MTDKTLRTLDTGTTPEDGDLFLTRQGSDTQDKKVTFAQLKAAVTVDLFNTETMTLDDINQGTVNKQFTETEKSKLSNIPLFNTVNVSESRALTAADNGVLLYNTGAGAEVIYSAALSLFVPSFKTQIANMDSDGTSFSVAAGAIIRFGDQVSSDGGSISTTDIGAVINLCQISASVWIVTSATGSWVVN